MVEVDSLLLVQLIQRDIAIPWNISYIFREITSFLPHSFVITHMYREANEGADRLANWGIKTQSDANFETDSSLPHNLKGILRLDSCGLPHL